MNGLIFRSKVKQTEDGHKNSKYFLTLEKRNYVYKHISTLELDGKIIKNNNDVSKAHFYFYKNLYRQNGINPMSHIKIPQNPFQTVKIYQNWKKNKTNSVTEILKSLIDLHNGKTPGTDGLPTEFYKCFWMDIKLLLVQSIHPCYVSWQIINRTKRGIITLLSKKAKINFFFIELEAYFSFKQTIK